MPEEQQFTVEYWPLKKLTCNPENYRRHTPEQIAVLRESLRRFGWYKNIVVTPEGVILAGHGVAAAAQAEGQLIAPVYVFHGTEAEARALMVADNEQSRLAQDDPDQLSQLLASLQADGLMQVTGHDDASLQSLLQQVAAQAPLTGVISDGHTIARRTLAERFGVPPFSVLDARQGYWQERKRAWLSLGIRSELGRGSRLLLTSEQVTEPGLNYYRRRNRKH